MGPAVAELFDTAGRVISFVCQPGDAWHENVSRLINGKTLACVPARPRDDFAGHIGAWHRRCLHEHGIEPAMVDVAARHRSDGPMVIHPGSGGAEKCWPRERYAKLIERLKKDGREVVVLLGEVELATWPTKVLERWVQDYLAQPVLELSVLYEQLAGASVYVGNDSGPTHLAGQLGCRRWHCLVQRRRRVGVRLVRG